MIARRLPDFIILLALALMTYHALRFARTTTNPRSRLLTVERLATTGEPYWAGSPLDSSKDHVRLSNGRILSSKPPVYSYMMAVEVTIIQNLTGKPMRDHWRGYAKVLVLINQVIPFAGMLVLVRRYLRRRMRPGALSWLIAALSFGSLAFGYATTLNNHTVAATGLVLAFLGLAAFRDAARWRNRLLLGIGAGLAAGLAASIEIPSAIFIPIVAGMVWGWGGPRIGLPAAVASVLFLGLSAAYYYSHSGSVLPFQLQDGALNYADSYWEAPQQHDALEEPALVYAFHALFGFRGLFLMSPVMLLWPLAGGMLASGRWNGPRLLWLAATAGALVIMGYIILFTHNYGGYAIGMRWFIQFSPLVLMASWPAADWLWRTHRAWRMALIGMLILSLPAAYEALSHDAFILSWYEMWLRPEISQGP